MNLLDWIQRQVDREYREKMERKERFIELRQESVMRYLAGEITEFEHEARVEQLRKEFLAVDSGGTE